MTKGTWRGRPVEQLTREELEDALAQMSKLYLKTLKEHSDELEWLTPAAPYQSTISKLIEKILNY